MHRGTNTSRFSTAQDIENWLNPVPFGTDPFDLFAPLTRPFRVSDINEGLS